MRYLDAVQNISVNDVKVDLMRTAYDNERALLNKLDPRVVLLWTVLFMIIPWLFYDTLPLAAMLVAALALAALSQVSKYLLALLVWGSITNVGFLVVLTALYGGTTGGTASVAVGLDAAGALLPFTLKVTIISVISLAVFSAMSPKRLSQGMLRLRVPRPLTFAITYGYRMMPVLLEEYHDLINSFRLRSKVPEKKGWFKWRYYAYLLKLSIKAFYPLVFNVAKRSRVTVEAMETKGFSHSLGDAKSRGLRTDDLEIKPRDIVFVSGSLMFVVAISIYL